MDLIQLAAKLIEQDKQLDQLARMLQTIDTRLASHILHSNAGCICPPVSEYPPASSWRCPVHGRMETE